MSPDLECSVNAEALILSAKRLCERNVPDFGEPPPEVVANIVLLALNAHMPPNAIAAGLMRAIAASGVGLNQPRNNVRTELLSLFDRTWADFAKANRRDT